MIVRRVLPVVTGVGLGLAAAMAWRWLNPPRPTTGPAYAAANTAAAPMPDEGDEEPPEGEDVPTVRVVHPKRDRTFTVNFSQFATVEPYYQAELRARASGVVKYIPKDVGGRVAQGELLVEIDVPDLRQEVAQKDAVVDQRRQELKVAKAQLKTAEAYIEVAGAAIDQARTLVTGSRATRDLREKRFHRFQSMLVDRAVNPNIVDEEERDFLAAQAAWEAAKVAVRRAEADLREKGASLEAAQADIRLKEALIDVALRDRDRTQAQADYARLTAPFDGEIVQRDVDLGTFVQNATASATKPLLTVARTDVVTVVTHLPDNVAPFVTRDTRVVLHLDELPGVAVEGRVTRFARSVQNQDRTMQVEVDLFNGSGADHAKFLAQYFGCQFAATGGATPLAAGVLAAVGRDQLGPRLKSVTDPLPLRPAVLGAGADPPRLMPGMSGQMKVFLQKFANAYLLPSNVVFNSGGKAYIAVVEKGHARRVPVRVQVNDGVVAKVMVVARPASARTSDPEVLQELTGAEAVVAGRQAELADGQGVRTYTADW